METTTTAQGSFGDLSLPFDPIFDPRWQNIYQPAHDASSFDWMHYRTPDDDLSSASSSSDGSYAHSIYSASSDLGNPLNYPLHAPPSVFPSPPYDPFAAASASAPTLAPQHQQHQHTASPPPTTTNAPSTTTSPAAWASMYTNPYQHDPYQQQHQHQHHQSHQPSHAQGMAGQPLTGRDSGEWDSYSSGGEEPYPSYPVPHNPHLQQQHQQPPPNQQQGQNQGMYGAMNLVGDLSASSGGGGGAGPGGSYSQQHGGPGHPNNPNPNSGAGAKELHASPSPPSANNAYEYDYDSRRVAQQQYSASPYPSPTTQPQAQGQGGSRLTPELSQLSIGQQGQQGQVRYTPGPLSPASQLQQQYAPASGSPGPSRTRASGHAQVPYGRPPGHRYAQQQVQHQHTISGSSGSAPSSSSSQGQGQVQYSPTGATAPSGGKIFGTATLPPLPSSNSLPSSNPIFPVSSNAKSIPHQHQSQQQQLQQEQQQERKPRKEMVAGTPTHPDIPRPANVAAPVPVPHLTKKSRGRQVPSVNSVHSVQSNQSQSVQSNSNRRSTGTGSNESRSRERNSYDESRSPLSPGAGGQMQNAGYFGHPSHPSHLQQQSQYSDDERDFHHAQAQIPHPHRSLFGQPIDEHGSYAAQGQGAGSASSMSSPATSLSSRRTAERERDARDELEHGSLPPLSSITGVPSSAQQPASNGAPTPGSLEAELRSRPFVCTVEGCGKAYIRAEHLKRHVRSIHTNDKPYECPHPGCGREFSRYDNLCQHFKGVHGPTSGSKNFPSA